MRKMMSNGKLRVTFDPDLDPYQRAARIDGAIRNLVLARDALIEAGAPKTLARVRLALTSAQGAKRNAMLRESKIACQALAKTKTEPCPFCGEDHEWSKNHPFCTTAAQRNARSQR